MELSEYASKLRELADVIEEQNNKCYVQVFPGGSGYLNVDRADDRFLVQNSTPLDRYKTQFTKAEIEDLKINPALKAINWDEVKLIPAD